MIEKEGFSQEKKKLILGLVGSPRKLGNCELMIKEIGNSIPEEHDLHLIRLPSLSIEPCNACYGCVMDKACPHEDDMDFLLRKIAEADAFIIASPVYFLGAHSIFKRVLDRGFLLYRILRETHGKPCILLNLYGIKDRIGAAPHTLMAFASFLGLRIQASVNVKAALPGEALLSKRCMMQAKSLANRLFSDKGPARSHGCPYCGCDIVRMKRKELMCTVCHGSFTLDESGKAIKAKEGVIFGSADHMLLHKRWLAGMKEEFVKRRKEILRMTIPYKTMGEWIEPDRKG